jgi:probable F420-dependent oxidoreductase
MKLGVFLPYTEISTDPGFIREFVQAAEALGYAQIHVPDQPVRSAADRERAGRLAAMYDPLALFAHLAALTRTIEFVTSILILPLRQTLLVAKQAAEVDVLSGGRLRLGVGTGARAGPDEYAALGADYESRGPRQEEQVRVLRLLWANDRVDFDGSWHTLRGACIDPRPALPIPVWFGGGTSLNPQSAEPVLRRAARAGDGWMPLFRPDDVTSLAARARLFRYLEQEGRDPAAFGIEGYTHVRVEDPERWRERVEAWRSFGATHVTLRTINAGFTSPQQHLDAIRRYIEAVR